MKSLRFSRIFPARQTFRRRAVGAFTLVEVTVAIGILSFCLLSLFGLMPVGMSAVKTAREEAAAGSCLNSIAASIRKAKVDTSGTNYTALGPYSSDLVWSMGGGDVAKTLNSLSQGGMPGSSGIEERFVARVEIHPPTSSTSTGTARVSVAWPATATWTTNWENAQGSVSTWLVFLPTH